MIQIQLYEEAMCCSTGVCGPDPDDELVQLSAALDQLADEFETVDISAQTSSTTSTSSSTPRRSTTSYKKTVRRSSPSPSLTARLSPRKC